MFTDVSIDGIWHKVVFSWCALYVTSRYDVSVLFVHHSKFF